MLAKTAHFAKVSINLPIVNAAALTMKLKATVRNSIANVDL
jgi:hypothetical protein